MLIWNLVLLFVSAWAALQDDNALAQRASVLAMEFPGLPSNQITRAQQVHLRSTRAAGQAAPAPRAGELGQGKTLLCLPLREDWEDAFASVTRFIGGLSRLW